MPILIWCLQRLYVIQIPAKRNQNVAHILRNVQNKALNKTSTITNEGQAMTSRPMNYFKSISKFVLQPDYCAVKRPPQPFISFVKNA
jgi:hypothetical protein